MRVYAFDLMPWPHLEAPSYYPDPNRLYDPLRGRQVYEEHLRQMELYEEYGYDAICINDLMQKEGLSIIGDPDYVTREIQAQMQELGAGVIMGLFQFGSLPHDLAQKNIRLFAETVLPALKRT
jgi:hypothetical protein